MFKKCVITLVIFYISISNGYTQNLIPFNWKLTFDKDSIKEESIPFNMLLSWQSQGISDLKPKGLLQTNFFVPKQKPINLNLEVTLLADVDSIHINDHYIGGGFSTKFKWAKNPSYEPRKFTIPHEYLKFNKQNRIAIKCSNYSYTGGRSHNSVKIYSDSLSNSEVKVSYDLEDHLFESNDKVSFDINVNSNSEGLINLIIRNDFHKTLVEKEVHVTKGKGLYPVDLSSKKLNAGFYHVTAILKDNGYVGVTSFFTIAPTKIEHSRTEPEGYTKYWKAAIEELKMVKPNFKIEKRYDLDSETRNGYIIKMKSIGNVDIYGYYFVPKKKGEYPAILHLPGYGYGFEHLDSFLKNKNDVIELALCVRGHGLSENSIVTEFPIPGFFGYEICDPNKIAYRQIYMDCLRAVDFLISREEVNISKIGVMGTSQGGGLALMTAGLMPQHISACAYGDPFPTDMQNHIRIRTLIEDELKSYLDYYDNKCSFEDGLKTFDLFDTKYFAKYIKASTLYVTGLFDDDCPPRLGFSAFNEINAPKEFLIFPNDSHVAESNWNIEMMNFFKKEFRF